MKTVWRWDFLVFMLRVAGWFLLNLLGSALVIIGGELFGGRAHALLREPLRDWSQPIGLLVAWLGLALVFFLIKLANDWYININSDGSEVIETDN